MAEVRVQLTPEAYQDAMVTLEIKATVRELDDYARHNTPSHAVAHRLKEAVVDALQELRKVVVVDLTRGG